MRLAFEPDAPFAELLTRRVDVGHEEVEDAGTRIPDVEEQPDAVEGGLGEATGA